VNEVLLENSETRRQPAIIQPHDRRRYE
jgi:hypothetical protein